MKKNCWLFTNNGRTFQSPLFCRMHWALNPGTKGLVLHTHWYICTGVQAADLFFTTDILNKYKKYLLVRFTAVTKTIKLPYNSIAWYGHYWKLRLQSYLVRCGQNSHTWFSVHVPQVYLAASCQRYCEMTMFHHHLQ